MNKQMEAFNQRIAEEQRKKQIVAQLNKVIEKLDEMTKTKKQREQEKTLKAQEFKAFVQAKMRGF